jgi:hypothetical protein
VAPVYDVSAHVGTYSEFSFIPAAGASKFPQSMHCLWKRAGYLVVGYAFI